MRSSGIFQLRNRTVRFALPIASLLAGLLLVVPGVALGATPGTPPAAAGEDLGPYGVTPQPLTVAQCAQCHPREFNNLKQDGGKHRFGCQDCHEVFHAYNPLRKNYAELMPKCASCHEQPHGAKVVECLNCHTNPHTPLKLKASDYLGTMCQECHPGPPGELKSFPSAHSKVGCQSCHHDRHGYIPQCFECHDPHYPQQPVTDCTQCHPVHKPLQITFSKSDNPATCASCHDEVYNKWKNTKAKHGKVSCTTCHLAHGQIPNCRDCHQPPHDKKMLEMFPDCLTCHFDPHDMPVKKKGEKKVKR